MRYISVQTSQGVQRYVTFPSTARPQVQSHHPACITTTGARLDGPQRVLEARYPRPCLRYGVIDLTSGTNYSPVAALVFHDSRGPCTEQALVVPYFVLQRLQTLGLARNMNQS